MGGKEKPSVVYRECRRNHAASTGGYVLDGCTQFLAAGEEGTPAAFKCAACNCHRNFHRQEIGNASQNSSCKCNRSRN